MAGIYGCFKGNNNDSVAMASEPPDVMTNQEPVEVTEECSKKKKSKFQTFKKLFARKKRKETSVSGAEAGLKASQSSDNVNNAPDNEALARSEKDNGSGSKLSLGSKALSHDSIFVSDSSEATEALGASQDSIHGKVKSLQLQLKQAIRLGSPPSLTCVKRLEDGGTTSEDDGLPCSPPEYSTLHTVLGQRNSSLSLEGTDSDDDQLSCATSSRAVSPLVAVPGDFSQPASPFGCLDNSASKHKLGLRHKACNKRRPATRVEIRPEEGPRRSTPEPAEQSDSSDQPMLTHKEDEGDRKEEEEDDEREIIEARDEEEGTPDPPKHSKHSPEPDTGEEEGKEDLDTREDISHPPGTPCSPLPSGITRYLPEEEREEKEEDSPAGPASGASSLDSTRVSPEPPAGPREYLLDPPGTAYGRTTENDAAESQALLITTPTMTMGERGEEDEDEEVKMEEEEEGSFLQEVLDSLRGSPLHSCGPGPESVFAGPEKLLAEEKEQEEVVSEEEQEQGADILEAEAAEQVEESAVEELEDVEAYRPSAPSAPVSQQKEEEPAPGGTATSCPAVGYVKEEDDGQNVEEEEEEDEVHVVEQPGVLEEKVVENKEAQGAGRESPTNEEEEEENATPSNEVERSEETEVGQEEDGQEQEFVDDDEGHEAESEGEEEAMALKNDVEVEGKEHGQEKQAEEENEVEREEEREREEKATVEETVYEETTAEEMEEEKEEESEASCDAVVLSSSAAEQEPTHTDMIPTVASGQVPEATPDGRAAYQPGTDDGVCGEGENQSAEAGGEEDEKVGDVEATEGAAADSIEDGRAVAEVDELTTNETHVDRKSQSDIDEMVMDQEPEPANSFQPSGLITAVSQSYAEIESQADGKDNAVDANADTPFDASPVLASSGQGESCLVEGSLPRSDSTVEDEEPTHLGPTEQNTDRQTCTGEVVKEELAGTVEEMGGGGGEVRGVSNNEEEEEEEEEPTQLSDIASVAVETEDKLPSVGAKRGRARFTVAPSWQRSPPVGGEEGGVRSSMETPVPVPVPRASSPPPRASASAVASEDRAAAVAKVSVATSELALSPVSPRSAGVLPARPPTTSSVTEESTVLVEENPENPFGVRLRRTAVLLPRRCSEEENAKSNPDPPAQPIVNKVAPSTPISVKPSLSQPISVKPTLPKKPEVQARMPEPSTGHGGSVGSSDSPRWVSMARQKQKIYKDGSLDAASAAKKGELERKSSLPTYVSSAACREPIKAPVSPCKVGSSETAKTVSPADKEVRSSLSPPAPVPPKPLSHPGPIAPKPYSQFTTATPKQPSQPTPFKGALPPPTLVPVVQRLSPCTSPPPLTKAPLPQPATLPSAKTPVPQSTALDVGRPTSQAGATAIPPPSSCRPSGSAPPVHLPRAQGPSGPQTLMPARGQPASGSPPPALPQDEPPWMALAKKKAKAWSEMPQIVQ